MRNIQQAIAALGKRAELRDFALDASGRAVLVFDNIHAVEFRAVGDTELEMFAPVEDADPDISREVLLGLLSANFLGETTGPARIALDPGGEIVLCERVVVGQMDEDMLEKRVLAFVDRLDFWHSSELEPVLEGWTEPAAETLANDMMIIAG